MTEQHQSDQSLHRLLFFSDAVFAIVLTLLVLELRPPALTESRGLFGALGQMAPHFIAFFASFALVSVFWAAHVSIMRRLRTFDWLVAWINLGFLFVIGLMPFASALLGEHGVLGEAWQVYDVVLIAASFAQTGLLLSVYRGQGRLVGGFEPRELKFRLMRALSPAIAFGAGLVLSLAGAELAAALCWLLFAPILLLARALFGPKPQPMAAERAAAAAGAEPQS